MRTLFLLACVTAVTAGAQVPYTKIIQHPGIPLYATVYSTAVSPDGRIAVLGAAQLGQTISVYNDSAVFLWGKRLAPASVTESFIPLQVQWMPNGDILLTGTIQSVLLGGNIGMMRLDASGNVQWTQKFQISSGGWTSFGDARALVLASGELAVLSSFNTSLVLSKFDANGIHLWSQTFPDLYVDFSYQYGIVEQTNGDILIRDGSRVIRSDPSGNVLFGHAYEFTGEVDLTPQVYLPQACPLSDGGFILQSIVDYYPALIRFDSLGAIVWAKKYDYADFYQPWFQSINELPGGDILAFPTSYWNRTIGLRVGPAGDPISISGVGEGFRLWPGDASNWSIPFAGAWDSLYHFVGSVEQLVNGGFTPPQTLLMRVTEDLVPTCVSVLGTFTSVDIVGNPPPTDISATQTVTCAQSSFAHDLQDIPYSTEDACPLIIGTLDRASLDEPTVFPTQVEAGGAVHIRTAGSLIRANWSLIGLNGNEVATGMLSADDGVVVIPVSATPGIHVLRFLGLNGEPLVSARILIQ